MKTYHDCTPDELTLCFTIIAWYLDIEWGAGDNDEVRKWTDERPVAIMNLIPDDAEGIWF